MSIEKTVYVVGVVKNKFWELQGIYNEENKAISACISSLYFFAPVFLNTKFPEETTDFPKCYFPKKD